jgi:DNA polymerase-3 subunit delta'
MSWERVIGQERVKKLLTQILISGKIPSAFLFDGPEGVGKDALAIELAKTLNCEKSNVGPCEECGSCRQANALHHPNIRLLFPLPRGDNETKRDGPLDKLDERTMRKIKEELSLKAQDPYHRISVPKAQVIKISSIREVIREDSLSLYQHGMRVIIVIQAEEVGTESANALLKVLEEPSARTVFILTTSKRSSLLPTIVSRCQTLRFDLLSENEIEKALASKYGIQQSDAKLKARLASGSYGRAIDLVGTDTLDIREEALDILREVATNNYSQIASRAKKSLESKDLMRIETLLKMVQIWLRDAAVVYSGLKTEVINQDKIEVLEKMVKSFDGTQLVSATNRVDAAISQLYSNVNLGILFVNLLMNLSGLLNGKKQVQSRRDTVGHV